MDQPIPEVSRADVERIVRRDFAAAIFATVVAFLDDYEADNERGRSRVQLAMLKLADGSLEVLRREVAEAKRDYRDVLCAAEYPGFCWDSHRLPKEEREKIIDADWQQYTEWLNR